MPFLRPILLLLLALLLPACDSQKSSSSNGQASDGAVLRVGHFPNITHAQAVIGHELSKQGKGWFEERIGSGVKLEWFVYNAGPSAMEAMFTNSIDMTYVGTGPMLNAYTKSKAEEIRLVAGSAVGGAALVVPKNSTLSKPEDFRGKKIATPQLGNTQDIACRVWLRQGGLKITQLGGDAQVVPTENPDQLGLFQQGVLDAVWTVEPWVSRLEIDGGGKIVILEKDAITTVLSSSVRALKEKSELVAKFTKAHRDLTEWINQNPDEAKKLFLAGMKRITTRDLSPALLDNAWPRLTYTSDIEQAGLDKLVRESQTVDFFKGVPDLGRLMAVQK